MGKRIGKKGLPVSDGSDLNRETGTRMFAQEPGDGNIGGDFNGREMLSLGSSFPTGIGVTFRSPDLSKLTGPVTVFEIENGVLALDEHGTPKVREIISQEDVITILGNQEPHRFNSDFSDHVDTESEPFNI